MFLNESVEECETRGTAHQERPWPGRLCRTAVAPERLNSLPVASISPPNHPEVGLTVLLANGASRKQTEWSLFGASQVWECGKSRQPVSFRCSLWPITSPIGWRSPDVSGATCYSGPKWQSRVTCGDVTCAHIIVKSFTCQPFFDMNCIIHQHYNI